jgi:hypothetical protein
MENVYNMPGLRAPIKIGSAATCDLRLHDGSGQLSREHALMVPSSWGAEWEICDLGSKNGLSVDGVLTAKSKLEPGAKIQLGGLELIAESAKFIDLHSFVCRLIGWSDLRRVDDALQCLRDYAARRATLVLVGHEDLLEVAMRLHRELVDPSSPFHVYTGGNEPIAIQSAMQGTLCVPVRRKSTAAAIADAVYSVDLAARPRLVLCTRNASNELISSQPGRLALIFVPSLAHRTSDTPRLIQEIAEDLAREMNLPSPSFQPCDTKILQAARYSSMQALEYTIRRLVILRNWGVSGGAQKLGIAHPSLSQWARSRGLPT